MPDVAKRMSSSIWFVLAMTTAELFARGVAPLADVGMVGGAHPALVGWALPTMPLPGKDVAGFWVGTLKPPMVELRLIVTITKKKDGGYTGTMDSPDQAAKRLTIDSVHFEDGVVRFEMKSIKGRFDGRLNEDGSELGGRWKQNDSSLPLTFKRVAKLPDLSRPQDPKKPYPYIAEEVAYENPKAKVKFAATLTLPKGKGPFPAVLLITGSGPQDRDEAIFGHRPFLVLADHLTRKGIAVLRADDRGVGGSTGNVHQATTADFADDALAGVAFLKGRAEIDAKRIGLVGHSEGGIVAPMAASTSPDIAFIVLLAGTGLTGEEILYLQGSAILKANGASATQIAAQHKLQSLMLSAVKEEKDNAAAEKRFREHWAKEQAKFTDEEKKTFGDLETLVKTQFKTLLTPWFRFFLTHDPRPALTRVTCPVLALNGDKDLQVPSRENLAAIAKALEDAGNKNVTLKELPKLNHLFQTCKTGSPVEYAAIQETFAPAALEMIGEWILKQTRP
jgi:fermentation-respiration switch protein FrsA (DUF1100 family)